jgi:TolA-binding protein
LRNIFGAHGAAETFGRALSFFRKLSWQFRVGVAKFLIMPRVAAALLTFLALGVFFTARADDVEDFAGATAAFTNKFYERSEQQFAEFVRKHPTSTNVSAAILYQAQSRLFQRKPDAAIELLQAELRRAGSLADQFQYWQAEALSEKNDFAGASAAYARVAAEFPQSPLALQASYLQANSQFQAKNFTNTIELLRNPEGAFHRQAQTNLQENFAVRGHLLLGEALLALQLFDEARAALAVIPALADRPVLDWERHHLAARIEFAGSKPEAALPHLAAASAAAQASQRPPLQAQSWNLEAETNRKLTQTDQALGASATIVAAGAVAPDQRRLAMLKSVELLSGTGHLTNAIARIEAYLGANTNEPAADLLRLKAGELWIERLRASATPALATNALAQARGHLTHVLTHYTNSAHLGRAWLNLGWTHWEEGIRFDDNASLRQSETAFRNAAEKLTRSDEQALAIFKLADSQLHLGRPQAAATNYLAVLRNFADLPRARSSLFDVTYRQLTRAMIEANDLGSAEKILGEYRQSFANTVAFEETLYLYGRALARDGRNSEARAVFQDFLKNYPGSTLVPQVRFSESRTYGGEGNWTVAIEKQEQWLAIYTNHPLRGDVEFQRALLHEQADQRTNALRHFTEFVVRFPAHDLAPAAQNWVADYYYEREQWLLSEQNYQRLFQNTNWLGSRFHFPARMMAARSAFFRQGFDDARSYLTNIIQDPRCPVELKPEALFALGDLFIEQPIVGNTNAVANFVEAAKVFNRIVSQYPTNRISPLAQARLGDCHAQLTEYYPESFADAMNAYRAVLDLKPPAVSVSARNQAEVGLALLIRRDAEKKNPEERAELLRKALNHLLNVVYGTHLNGESPDPFFLKKAGLEAGRIAESLGDEGAALELYRRLIKQAPSLRTFWEGRIASMRQRVAAASPGPALN